MYNSNKYGRWVKIFLKKKWWSHINIKIHFIIYTYISLGDGHLGEIIKFIYYSVPIIACPANCEYKGFYYWVTLYQQQSQGEAEGIWLNIYIYIRFTGGGTFNSK